MTSENQERLRHKIRTNVALLLVFVIILSGCAYLVRQQLMDNAREMGTLLLDSYAENEEDILSTYVHLLTLCTQFIDQKEQEGASIEEIKSGLYPYLDGFCDLYAGDAVRAIGLVGDYVISNDPDYEDFDDGLYDFRTSDWYKKTMEADGEVYISDGYYDYETQRLIVTIAQKAQHSDSICLFDIFIDEYHTVAENPELPDNGAYYLCDSKGTVMYYDTTVYHSYEEIQKFAYRMLDDLNNSGDQIYIDSYEDAQGNRRSGFIRPLNNGWVIILTIPRENTLGGMDSLYWVIGIVFAAGLVLTVFLGIRDYRGEKRNQKLVENQKLMEQTTQVYQKTVQSTLRAYRKVFFIDLEKDVYQVVYPESNRDEEGRYDETVTRMVDDGVIGRDNPEGLKHFLSLEHIRKELDRKEFMEMRLQHTLADGSDESCTATIVVSERVRNKPVSVTLAFRCIEDMLRKEEKQRELLVLAAKRAEAANNAKSDFLSNMSHDIRTPMNAILGMTSIAMVHIDDKEKVMDALNKITRSGKHLLGIINSVLDMSKIESGKLILDETNFNLLRSLEDLKDLFQSQFRAKHLDFTLDAASIEHAEVVGDEQRLQQVFVNILGNAVKFTPEGGKITVTAREKRSALYQRGSYEFIFEDNGIGMEKEFVERVFEPFVRATDSRITNIEGSGLGMAIAQNVVRLMGGDIQVESEPGKGSRFTVAVSLRLNDTIPEENKPREQSKTAELEELIAHDYSDKRALLVDDNELNIEVAKELLGMAGLQVDTAGNGREAVDQLTNSPPGTYDLVFMDIQMPVMNGYEATRAIRNSEREDLQKIPIIAMTADAFAEDIKKAREAGMSGHIAKPIDISRLEQNMEEWLK